MLVTTVDDNFYKTYILTNRIDDLNFENEQMTQEIQQLRKMTLKKSSSQVSTLQNAIAQLEHSVKLERKSHHQLVDKLRSEKNQLTNELEKIKNSEQFLRSKLKKVESHNLIR